MADRIAKLKWKIKKMLGRTASASADEKTEVQKRLRVKYPQMYEAGTGKGTRSIMDAVRVADPSSAKAVGKSRTQVLKKKYRSK